MFRAKLSHIKTEDELFKFFCERAGYDEQAGIYVCVGVAADDTRVLFEKLKAEWLQDIADDAKRSLTT